ncbi:hypothetical protein [Piscinibacter sakaiensis]|uniref:hypothetical protein n=1 Tax=Piscinibacter sakaiensis TaxID=1547922 RepID=UPI003AAF1739
MKTPSLLAGLLICCAAAASASTQEEFPSGAASPSAAELKERLAGKSFDVQLKNGISWRLQYNTMGYFFVDASTGGRTSGSWSAEDGKLCSQLKGNPSPQCSDVRVHQNQLVVRRTVNGELITLVPR